MARILVLNAGSSSIKVSLFGEGLAKLLDGSAEGIGGGGGRLKLAGRTAAAALPDHAAALAQILSGLAAQGIDPDSLLAVGHRVVHGGAALTAPARVTAESLAAIEAAAPLAPLHNPVALMAIRALAGLAPDLPQVAVFDTAFHAGQPEVARRYAIPDALDAAGLRRYGFHGISYAALVEALRPDLPGRLLAFHLGNGASICAIRDGASVATTMGYSPLDGLTMGTRSGALDPGLVLRLARELGPEAAEAMLNGESGLRALAGDNDMARLLERDDDRARFAVDHFCYWAVRHAGSLVAAMGGLDAMVFTGGIGENAPAIRARISAGLGYLGAVPVQVVAAAEDRQIARETGGVLAQAGATR